MRCCQHGVYRLVQHGTVARSPDVAVLSWLGSQALEPAMSDVADAARKRGPVPVGAPFDFDKFFDQMLGRQTPEQKQALEQVEIAWQDEEQFGRQALDQFLADLRRQNIRVFRGARISTTCANWWPSCGRRCSMPIGTARSPSCWRSPRKRTPAVFPAARWSCFAACWSWCQNEAALVGVIGHELSHIDHGHQLRYLKSMKLAQRTFTGGVPADPRSMMNNTMLLTSVFARPFRPEDEAEADQDGATWAYRAGYDPRELAKLFLRFEAATRETRTSMMPAFFRTHPYDRQRYEAVLKRYEELVRTEPRGHTPAANLRDRVPRSQREFDD